MNKNSKSRKAITTKKESFSSRLGFILAAVAAAVGMSNIWRFPSEVAQFGGGIYVLFYMLCIFIVGYPMTLVELAFGRSKQEGLYENYKGHGRWAYLGALTALVSFLVFCFYNVVAGWVVGYFCKLCSGALFHAETKGEFTQFYESLRENWQGNLVWTFIMMIAALLINQAGVRGGIERCAQILMPIFLIMIVGLVGYSLTLKGAGTGISFFLWPAWDKVSWQGLAYALSQSFMSLSIGMGILITYGAFVNKKDNLYSSSFIIVVGDTLVAIFAGFFLFGFLGYKGIDFANISDEKIAGPGLAFITLPLIFYDLGTTGTILAGAFFLLLIFAAITSSISILAVPVKYVEKRFGWRHDHALWTVGLLSFVVSMGCILADSDIDWLFSVMKDPDQYNFREFLEDFAIRILTPITAFLFCIFTAFQWKVSSVFEEVSPGKKPQKYMEIYITICIKYIAPIVSAFSAIYSIWAYIAGV